MSPFARWLSRRSRLALVGLAAAGAAAVGLVDFATGRSFDCSLLYALPVALAAWYADRRAGIVLSVLSVLAGYVADARFLRDPDGWMLAYGDMGVNLWVFLVIALVVSSLRKAWRREHGLSRVDYLTGVGNARAFSEFAGLELGKAQRYRRPFTEAYVDVDDFKVVNDRFGHAAGDTVLTLAAHTLQSALRATDMVGRLGGDEFGLLLSETGPDAAKHTLEKIRRSLADVMERNGWPVTFSVGAATFLSPPDSVQEVVRRTDRLMYAAKQAGKNRLEYEIVGDTAPPETLTPRPRREPAAASAYAMLRRARH